MLRDHLAASHIPTVVLGLHLAGAAGELPALNFPELWVIEDEDLPRAGVLVEAFLGRAAAAPEGGPWRCPRCGAEVDGGFELCWRCGAPREA